MIKIEYESKSYNYENVGSQPYDLKLELKIKEDANVKEAIESFLRVMKVAEYPINEENVTFAIKEYFANFDE